MATRIAYYRHRYQADLARGFLDDADIPCQLLSDDTAGGVSYIGGLAGAWVIVGDEDAERAREVLDGAGMLVDPEAASSGPAVELARRADTLPPVARSDLDDLTRALDRARKDEFRYFLRSVLGLSPAAVIPFIGLAREGRIALVGLLMVLVFVTEGWKGIKMGREVKRLEGALARLEEETRA